jgi:hypothetical protein
MSAGEIVVVMIQAGGNKKTKKEQGFQPAISIGSLFFHSKSVSRESRQESCQRLTSMTDLIFPVHRKFRCGLPQIGKKKIRIVTESAFPTLI